MLLHEWTYFDYTFIKQVFKVLQSHTNKMYQSFITFEDVIYKNYIKIK